MEESLRRLRTDYVDLIQGLRRGSRLSVDFLTMLGLAAAIASLGLLQDSPAVVIGSMLLAPLMTPMIGSGLSLAQANAKLGWNSLVSIVSGFLLTLAMSCIIAVVTPGEEMTSQVLARGSPAIGDFATVLQADHARVAHQRDVATDDDPAITVAVALHEVM